MLAYVVANSDLIIANGVNDAQRLAVNAPLDARILIDERKRLRPMIGVTATRYTHGVLGAGLVELLVPDQQRNHLAGIQHVANGAEQDWLLPLGGRLNSNLTAVELADGQIVSGAGRRDKVLRLWLPAE